MTTDVIELTLFITSGVAMGFSAWMLYLQVRQWEFAKENSLLIPWRRRFTIALFHFLKPFIVFVGIAWCLVLPESSLQAAVKNVTFTIVCVLFVARGFYEFWDVQPFFGDDRRKH